MLGNNIFKSFRSKTFMFFISSSLIAGFITWLIFYIAQWYYHSNAKIGDSLNKIREYMRHSIGDYTVIGVVFMIIFIVVLLIQTKRYVKMLDHICTGISSIADGKFDYRIDVRYDDWIGEIGQNVNIAATNLKKAVETGEYAKSSKERLVVNIAHDLRTPLTSINGYLDLIINNKSLTKEEISHYAQISYNKSLQMEKLIEQLFEYTQINFGGNKIKFEEIELSLFIKQIIEEFTPILDQNNLRCRLRLAKEKVFILANGDLLVRVFDNLLSNAIRYGKDGKFIDIELFTKEEDVVIRVINYDSLISKEDLPNIFESFYKGDKSRTSSEKGTGLGLAIAKNIIELHNGQISASSTFERTYFEIKLKTSISLKRKKNVSCI
ncbi:HAMP domain-containing sensor histidine kinase [Clostridiaceae bacterium M8S5]|nr:HAMP domain-containing sensor histidine kinase [Clostridiaceae bacterium M8S5]